MSKSIKVETNIARLTRKVSAQAFQRGRFAMANQVGMDSNKFIPKKTGALRRSQVIAIDGSFISWNATYAKPQYHTSGGWHYSTPDTGPRWDQVAKNRYMGAWKKAFLKGASL